jgi:hypothetical protein
MNKFRNRKSSFSTSSKKSTDNNFYYERNKHITDNSDKIDAVSTSPVDKSLTTEKLQEQLNNNMEQINKNMSSTKDILAEAKKVANSQTTHYGIHKSELDESQQNQTSNNKMSFNRVSKALMMMKICQRCRVKFVGGIRCWVKFVSGE